MKLAFFTDLQLDNNPIRDYNDINGVSIRFQESEATIAEAMDAAQALGAEGLLFGGDITEEKDPPSAVLRAAARLFGKWQRKWGVPGNHDGSVFHVSSSSIEPLALSAGEGFSLYQSVTFDRELRCLFIPYLHRHTIEQIRELIVSATADAGPGKIFVVMHYGPEGATVGAANTVLASDYLPASVFSGLDVDHVLCGHIHKAQELVIDGIQFHVAGSSLICNMGERSDRKTFGLFDTVTREYTAHEIKQPRRWVRIDWSQFSATSNEAAWRTEDIVAITGEHPRDVYPRAIIEEAIKAGTLPEPFHITYESKPQREERIARAAPINAEDGLREGMRKFVQAEFQRESDEPGQVGPATALAMDAVSESVGSAYCTEIWPTRISIAGFATIMEMDHVFTVGDPLLVLGENGIGKSNFMAALYWLQTGELPNGMGFVEAVNRNSDRCSVTVHYAGRSPESEEQQFFASRTVKIGKDGTPKHDLVLGQMDPVSGEWKQDTLNDGGIKERQQRLNALLGGSAAVQRIANFSIQDDSDPFIKAHPKVRKVVIGEVTGQDPLKRAHKKLDEARRDAQRALEDGKQRLSGVMAVAENAEAQAQALEAEHTSAAEAYSRAEAHHPAAVKASAEASKAEADAAASVALTDAQLATLPATAPAVAAADAALTGYKTSYEETRAKRLTEHSDLKIKADALDAELTALSVPTDEAVETLRAAAARAAVELETANAVHRAAELDSNTKHLRLDAATQAEKALQDKITTLPTPVDPVDLAALQEALDTAKANALLLEGAAAEAADRLASAREAAAGINSTLATLRTELSTFDGQDVGKCSRCGQPINSEHIEQETARIRKEIEEGESALANLQIGALMEAAASAAARHAEALAAAGMAQVKREAGLRDEEARVRASEARAALDAELQQAASALEVARSDAKIAVAALSSATAAQATALAAYTVARDAHSGAAEAVATATEKRTRLEEIRGRMAEIVAEGVADKNAYDGRVAELSAALAAATAAHTEAETKRAALTALLQQQRQALAAAQQATSAARVAEAQARAEVSAAQSLVNQLAQRIASLKEQVAQVEQARFEIKMLVEQAQITSTAVAITEQFRLALIDQAIPMLEDRTNYWLDQLGAGSITARFTTRDGEKDTLDILIDDGKPGRPLDIACYSGGQKRRVEMALKRALNELKRQSVGVTLGFHGYDEPTDGLDEKGKRAFIDMVLNDDCPVQIITSHDDSIIAAFNNSIRLVRGSRDETVMEGK